MAGPGRNQRVPMERLVSGDNRLRLKLTPGQQAALLRAVLLADRADLVAKLGLPAAAAPPDISADHPPVDVVLRTPVEFVADVERWLSRPKAVVEQDGVADLTYPVTHRAAFRARVHALGLRVEVVSPDDVRRELLAELEAMAGV